MTFDPLILARIQFAANISFHIIFPMISIALTWMLLYFKLRFNASGDMRWMSLYRLFVKVFALTFALGVVSGITMSFQFGTNWPGFMETVGNIAGPLLAYEVLTAVGIAGVSLVTPLLSQTILDKWLHIENLIAVWPLPLITAVLFVVLWRSLSRLPTRLAQNNEYGIWIPFYTTIGLFMLAFHGLAYSLFPWLIVDQMTIWDAAAAPESLMVIFVAAAIVLPVVVGYSIFVYRIFSGKAKPLQYY